MARSSLLWEGALGNYLQNKTQRCGTIEDHFWALYNQDTVREVETS